MSRPPGSGGPASPELAASVALVDQLQRALARQDRAAIVDSVGQLVARRAPLAAQWEQVAEIAADLGELRLSARAMELYVEGANDHPLARYREAALLARNGALREAGAVLDSLPEDVPHPAVNAYSRGAAAVFLGERDKARRLLERATVLGPQLGQAWLPLSTLVNFAEEPALAERIIAAGREMERAPPPARAVYCYALGKALDDLGEHARAFAAFAQGAQLSKLATPYDRAQDRADAAEAVRGFDTHSIAALARQQSEPTGRTIFLTGLPRSGTTLVQQILTSHSAVSDGAEINRLRMLAREVGGTACPPLARHIAERGAPSAARLWSHWLEERFPQPGRVVDKSMDTSRFLGLAAALLPDAPVIWMTRDPLDCAWSCYRTHFLAGVPWSCDLEDIAFHMRLEEQLLSRWRDILGDRLLVVSYETLVAEPAAWTRRILSHCGLDEEPAVFAPHENAKPVTTSSVMQVRRPINSDAVSGAQPYRAFLEPFLRAYGG